jgi:uncharacterized membrane protein YhdT
MKLINRLLLFCILIASSAFAQYQQPMPNEFNDALKFANGVMNGPMGLFARFGMMIAMNPTAAWAISIVYFVSYLITVYVILSSEKGSDRICWFLVVSILPIFGLMLYFLIGVNERHTREEAAYINNPSRGAAKDLLG